MEDTVEAMIYIVDDDFAIRQALETLLSAYGFRSRGFASPGEFLNFHDESDCSCLVLDARLPGMSGLDLLDRLSAEGRSMPVIMITGHGDAKLLGEARNRGVKKCLRKPFDCVELLESIRDAIEN